MKSNLFSSDTLSREDSSFLKAVISTMKFNLLWFIPLCLTIIIYFIIPNVDSGYHNIRLVFHRFTWGIFFSPSAYIFFSSILATIFVPLQLLLLIITFFDRENPGYRRRYLWTVVAVLGIVVSMFVLQIIIWGSFPLPVDSKGYIHLRLIPFIPWPEQPLF